MERIYPQDASRALATVQRRDETSKEYDLERQQSVAQVGDTVPLAFTRFENGVGGLWLMGHLIRLGIKSRDISLLYLLSQGELGTVAEDAIYYGGGKWKDLSSISCQAYQAIPPCVDIVPGDVTWGQTIEYEGPGLTTKADEVTTITGKSIYCSGFSLKIIGECFVEGTREVTPNRGLPASEQYTTYVGNYSSITQRDQYESNGISQMLLSVGVPFISGNFNSNGGAYAWNTSAVVGRKEAATIYSSVTYTWQVRKLSDNQIVRSGTIRVGTETQDFSVSGLTPGKYALEFLNYGAQRSAVVFGSYAAYDYQNPAATGVQRGNQLGTNSVTAWQYLNGLKPYQTGSYYAENISPSGGKLTEKFQVTEIVESVTINAGVQPDNTGAGLFADLTLLGLKGNVDIVRVPGGVEYFKQVTAYITEGIKVQRLLDGDRIGSSHSFADLALYLLRKGIREEQIDVAALRLTAAFASRYGMRFDGVLSTSQNLREWLGAVCPYFLCHVRQANGKIGIVPTLPVDGSGALLTGAVTPVMSFTQDDVAGYARSYVKSSDRKAFCAVMVFSEQNAVRPGGTVTVEVRYAGQAAAGPFEQHDLSDFCLQRSHAELAARYVLARRRHVTHSVQFQTADKGRQLLPGDLIRVTMATLGDDYLYQVDAVEEGSDGIVTVTAMHFPVDAQGRPLITLDLTSTSLEAR
jgi:hypothetical protein